MAKEPRRATIECRDSGGFGNRPTRYYYQEGTLPELIKAYSYTLETGQSYEREKGNHKINTQPKSFASLVKNLDWAVDNAAANGYSGKSYRVMADGEARKS